MATDPEAPSLTPQRVNDDISRIFPSASIARCVELDADRVLLDQPIDPAAARPGGFVSGPAQFALIDTALWYLTFGVLDRIEPMALTSDVDVTYLRPASGNTLRAEAQLLSAGSRRVVGSVVVWCDDAATRPTSVAKGAYVLPAEATAM